jgi:hypothetical protein
VNYSDESGNEWGKVEENLMPFYLGGFAGCLLFTGLAMYAVNKLDYKMAVMYMLAACTCAAYALTATNMTAIIQVILATPVLIGVVITTVVDEKLLGSNALTYMLGAVIGADLGADIGALACIDTGQ